MLRQPPNTPRLLLYLQAAVLISVILYFGRPVLVPLSFALLLSCILYPICHWLEQKGVGRVLAIVMPLAFITLLCVGLVALLLYQLSAFTDTWPTLSVKLRASSTDLSAWLTSVFSISYERQLYWLENFLNQSSGDAMQLLQKTLSASAVSAVLFILIPVYSVLILYYRQRWMQVVFHLFPGVPRQRVREILQLSIGSYYNFIKGMALVYLMVGLLNSIGLWLLGIPQSFFFGFMAAILTFIPYVGILVGSLVPISIAWITYNSIWYPIGVVIIFAFVQYLEANLIFPWAVSTRLKVNTLITIVAIVTGGILWGLAGMILFIPFLGILKLIADKTPALRTLALLLGDEPL